jgi:hypothetical protein
MGSIEASTVKKGPAYFAPAPPNAPIALLAYAAAARLSSSTDSFVACARYRQWYSKSSGDCNAKQQKTPQNVHKAMIYREREYHV